MTVGATTLIGLKKVDSLKAGIAALEGILNALELMRSEVYFKLTPIPEIIKNLAAITDAPVNEFFIQCSERIDKEDFDVVWNQTLQLTLSGYIGADDLRVLQQLGDVMGRYDLEGQLRSIDAASTRLTKSLAATQQDRANNSKVYTALGMAAGVVAVVLIL